MPARKSSPKSESALPNFLLACLVVVTGIWLIWDGLSAPLVTFGAHADYWEHSAALTEWLRNFFAPTNPHVASAELSSRYMPYFWILTALGKALGLNAIQLMSISLVVNFILIVVGLQLFLRRYFRDEWAPLVGFIAIFMLWGVAWNWSNVYQLRSFLYVGGYPSAFVFGLSLISFWATLKFLGQEGSLIVWGAILALLAALMLLCHPLTAVFGISGCVLLAFTEARAPIALRFALVTALVFGITVCEFWPYFSVWKLMLGQYSGAIEQWGELDKINPSGRLDSGAWQHMFYNPKLVVIMFGPALIGVPVLLWLLIKRQRLFIVSGAILMAIPFVANLFVTIPLAHRFLLFTITYLQFALVWFLLELLSNCRSEPRPFYGRPVVLGLGLAAIATVSANFALLFGEYRGASLAATDLTFRDKRALLPEGQSVVDVYRSLTDPLAEDSVVLATASLGWPLPTLKAKVVSLYHENPLVHDQVNRYQATGNFFYRPIDAEQRAMIIGRYDVSHVLISEADPELRP